MNSTPATTSAKRTVYTLLILAFYCLGQFGGSTLGPYYRHLLVDFEPATRSVIWTATYFGLVPLIGTLLIFGAKDFLPRMGLDKGFVRGLWVALVMTLPMFIGYAWLADGAINIEWGRDFWFGSVAAPFFEEFFFRAFLFGLLYRYAGWGLWPATLLDGFVFGILHVGQGQDFVEALSVFAVTGAGAVGFSIIYKEWSWNLWLVIFLHAFMNLSWMAFDVANNAAGGVWANVFRGMTILIAIIWSINEGKKNKLTRPVDGLSAPRHPQEGNRVEFARS